MADHPRRGGPRSRSPFFAPKTVGSESHKHQRWSRPGVVTKGQPAVIGHRTAISGSLTPGDTYRVPPNTSTGARVFEEPCQVIDIWAPAPG